MRNELKKKVAVAMSGGVDSSVTALLLKKAGYEVIGFHMNLGTGGEDAAGAARRVAQKLDIKFYPINLAPEFKKQIIKYFCESYAQGDTPNPCVRCNNIIKFGALYKKARDLGADYLATGHYVQVKSYPSTRSARSGSKVIKSKVFKLIRGVDKTKDQSYFLYTLDQERLAHVLFPLGKYRKDEIKKIASQAGLPSLQKESQDVCFITENGKAIPHNDFLKKKINLKPGEIKTSAGKVVGKHQGLPLYTVGQRRGVDIGGDGPYYVLKADYRTNILYVTNKADDPELYSDQLLAKDLNWVSGKESKKNIECLAQLRHLHKPIRAVVKILADDKAEVKFSKKERAIAKGQSVVFYDLKNKEVLGGGEIC